MTEPVSISFHATDIEAIASAEGTVAVIIGEAGKLDTAARRVNRLTKGALARLVESEGWSGKKPGEGAVIDWPVGLAAEKLVVLHLPRAATLSEARKAGGLLGKSLGKAGTLLLAGGTRRVADVALGAALMAYDFDAQRTKKADAKGEVKVMAAKPEEAEAAARPLLAAAQGVFFTRDLVNEPANVLTTEEFARRLKEMESLGLKVEVLEEADLGKLGMNALLAVGMASVMPSKVVVMEWNGGGDEPPLAFVGKGVVFDTGGISLKPAAGMEDMTMDMGGAGVVSGVMRTLALRKARANVVGLVGLVENTVAGNAQRPGDVVKSMKGDTIEVINTDAEGRLVLCDVLWYTQERFKPSGIVDLATLTGAMIIALGHENAGVFSNDDAFCGKLLKAAESEGEGAWRLPMGQVYDDQLKSRIADMKNVGGRPAGSITAAQFLRRFVKDETPWCHIDIAGVALRTSDSATAPKGATGWGVLALDRLVKDGYES
ncbi:putative cytosol aminopeptidase [Pseudooceanicola nanhaiensis]|uniref:Probable cytosol aminopeptidase n=1 Tax=Pseudooceanicola nanhaiensis TaxID=375761 RepID=A0A917SNW8_9RHOB|nr:leucyl aminopeptidase [Pseudooceanicola nanhaiensis]GGL89947.1 putative cytosol aminopeptidase [Pseudooceanicola nanhaiensis]